MSDEIITNTNPVPAESIQTETTPTPEPIPPASEAPSASSGQAASLTSTPSTPPETPPEAPEAPRNEDISKSSDIPENTAVNKEEIEKISTSSESLAPTTSTPTGTSSSQQTQSTETSSTKEETKVIETVVASTTTSKLRALFAKAREVIQFRKRKKLDKILTLFLKKSQITNDDVEKLLHISDATAGRYLSILEKEGKIKRSGKIGKGVTYLRI